MSDLLSAMVDASRSFAEPLAQSYAAGNRPFRVRLERPGPPGTFNRDTGVFNERTNTLIYEGPARIYPSSEMMQEVGDEERIPFNAVTITIDYLDTSNSPEPEERPQADDIVVVVDDSYAQMRHLPNRVFEITGVEVGGHIATGWMLTAVGAAPSRAGQTP